VLRGATYNALNISLRAELVHSGGSLANAGYLGNSITIGVSGWYLDPAHHIETIRVANGQQLLDAQVQNLVQAMASFVPPPLGQTTLSPSDQNSLEPVLAANWQ
jgi:hypothetical protein